ncbi:hypothetical protein [Sulfurimonas sp.]|uniref:hypothetical protein n=1 Tax=Sulfurimonas sp. TaxID=2022749 RepID=UPI002AB29DFB|nr:hypothetical protein [Sulfurimonas sp.]
MRNIKKLVINAVVVSLTALVMTGCSSMMEGLQSQMEVPTLENQANRVAIGMTIVRENNIMAFKMPISADAQWPALVASDINETQDKFIIDFLMDGPYFSTVHYSDAIQRRMLGSSSSMSMFGNYANLASSILNQKVKPLTKRAIQKIIIFYGEDEENWPNIFNFDSTLDNFLEFKDGNIKDIEAVTGDVYETLGEAVISLTPVNLQKDLSVARGEMLDEYVEVASIKSEKGYFQTKLKADEARTQEQKDEDNDYTPLTTQEKLDIEKEIILVETRIKAAESVADEKEAIYFELLDEAVVALESDINIDDENYVKLAKNVNIVSNEIQTGAIQAYTSFSLASANIISGDIVFKFPRELESLAIAKANVPIYLQANYDERLLRLVKNAVYLLPNILIGTYYANKQSSLAGKYESVTNIILLAHQAKVEQELAAKEAAEEAEEEQKSDK